MSPDGVEIAYVEGPDPRATDEIEDSTRGVDDWQVVIDDDDGEQVRFTVADRRLAYVTVDFDGRWLLVSGGNADGPVEPLLIDSEAPDLASYRLVGAPGEARIAAAQP